MTLPVACPPASCAPSEFPSVQATRQKRRRRAPTSGASQDCFACEKRNTKCDRRRPYCTQCLEIGKECSGYKTQLTWGVGVASRGKLRGLSLPVAKSAPAVRSPPSATRPRASSTRSSRHGEEGHVKLETIPSPSNLPENAFTTYDLVNMAAPQTVNSPSIDQHLHGEWNISAQNGFRMPEYSAEYVQQQKQLPQLHRLHTQSQRGGDGLGLSSSLESMSRYSEGDYTSPVSQSFSNEDMQFITSPMAMYSSFPRNAERPMTGIMGDHRVPPSLPEHYYAQSEMSSSISSHQNLYEIAENGPQEAPPASADIFYDDESLRGSVLAHDMDVYATSARSNHFQWTAVNDDEAASQGASEADNYHFSGPEPLSPISETSPRVSFFLDYYEKIICPSVVVMDGPTNPYRENILTLARTSRSLQHAICALAACNLRMKRRRSLGQDWPQQPFELELQDHINVSPKRPTTIRRPSNLSTTSEVQANDASLQEEYQHRSIAVSLLNQQLSDPSRARHDCILATLFILCHYRMCESGIAQFGTHFAGVRKILGMREYGTENTSWNWMGKLFTYFDGIAASINERDVQLPDGYLDLITPSSNPKFALENLAGCDSVLFRTIAKLGRLNMLSQRRPVSEHLQKPSAYRSARPQPSPGLAGQALADFYNLHAHNFDGNGFASTLDDDALFPNLTSTSSQDDLKTAFWTEWRSARQALQDWEFDPQRLVESLPQTPSPTLLRDFGYLSEAFRYAALLYTERLACPNLPSAHLNFQNLVSQVLFYVTSLEQGSACEKFLLWPLFISGSECVNELQQSIVRTKCREITGRSGYLNNLAGLDVLEQLWLEKHEGSIENKPTYGSSLKWTKHMVGIEGEWIMV